MCEDKEEGEKKGKRGKNKSSGIASQGDRGGDCGRRIGNGGKRGVIGGAE